MLSAAYGAVSETSIAPERLRDHQGAGETRLVPDQSLFYRSEILQWTKNRPSPFFPSYIFRKPAQLLGEYQQHFIFIIQLILHALLSAHRRQ